MQGWRGGSKMMIESGEVESLSGRPWAAIEFYATQTANESRVEEIVRHLAKWLRGNVEGPFQLFFPVRSRTSEGVTLFSPYLWVRGVDLRDLQGVRTVRGVEGLVSDSSGVLIPVDDGFVQELVEQTRKASQAWSRGVREGSFVRVLMGSHRMLCGMVEGKPNGKAVVVIRFRSRQLKLLVPVPALQNLGNRRKEYFYSESQNGDKVQLSE